MRLERLMLTAFGRFNGLELELKPGLNLLYGQNESGKTTIQQFIRGMLYGFKKRSLRREYAEEAARYRPWKGDEYRGALVYSLDATGRSYRVERVFDPNRESVRLYDELTGADLTGEFAMDRRKELLFAEDHLRLSAEVFTSTAWVGQMEVGRLEMGRELVQRVANLSESGREDLSVRAALRSIDERIREIGTDRAPTRPYARVSRLIGEKRQELERALKSREQTLEWEAGLREARAAMAALDEQLSALQRHLLWAELAEAEQHYERIQTSLAQMQAARKKARELSGFAFFPVEQMGRLKEMSAQVTQATMAIERHRRRIAELTEAKAALEGRLGQYAGLVGLGPDAAAEAAAAARMADSGISRLPGLHEEAARLEEMIARINEAIAPLTQAAEAGEEALEQIARLEQQVGQIRTKQSQSTFERLRAEVAQLERERRSVGGQGWLILAALLLVGAAVLYLLPQASTLIPTAFHLPVVGGVGVLGLLALVPYLLARRAEGQIARDLTELKRQLKAAESALSDDTDRIRRLEKQQEQVLRMVGVVSVGDLRNQLVRYEQLTARRDGQQLRRETVLAEIRRIESEVAGQQERLNQMLATALGEAATSIQSGDDSLARFQEAMSHYQADRFELDALGREVQELKERIAAEEQRIAAARAETETILQGAGMEDMAAFEEACAQQEEWRRAEREAEGLRTALSALLGDDEDGARAAREVAQLRARVSGERPAEIRPSTALQAEIRRLEAERSGLNARASDLAARVETAAAELADTADLEREIAALQEEKQEMERELAALELARSVIGEVSSQIHREFAPRLNQAMGQIVAELTHGRYQTVRIDEDLTIRAIAEGDRTVEITNLSGGTIDQFYLSLRVAILDLLTEGQERIPLLLDDPFVQYDNERLHAALTYLARAAEGRQVVLMTCHKREVEMGGQLGAHVVEL
ncbi:MAG: AAA family ATPase [Bacillota bacterium]